MDLHSFLARLGGRSVGAGRSAGSLVRSTRFGSLRRRSRLGSAGDGSSLLRAALVRLDFLHMSDGGSGGGKGVESVAGRSAFRSRSAVARGGVTLRRSGRSASSGRTRATTVRGSGLLGTRREGSGGGGSSRRNGLDARSGGVVVHRVHGDRQVLVGEVLVVVPVVELGREGRGMNEGGVEVGIVLQRVLVHHVGEGGVGVHRHLTTGSRAGGEHTPQEGRRSRGTNSHQCTLGLGTRRWNVPKFLAGWLGPPYICW